MKKFLACLILSILFCTTSYADGIDSDTKLMFHMDGADASTTFTDSELTPKTFTAVGSAQIDTAQSVFGGASGLFDGSADYVYGGLNDADWNFGTGDYTIDFRVRYNSIASNTAIFEMGTYASAGILFQRNTDNILYLIQSGVTDSVAYNPSLNTWYHIALVRQGRYVKMYIDGTLFKQFDFLTTQTLSSTGYFIAPGIASLNGWIDEFRVSKGIARWTTDFTPPAAAYSEGSAVVAKSYILADG